MGVVRTRIVRGDVWLVNLDPTMGAEIKKTRPCLVISPPEIHDHLRTVLMAPLTSKGFAAPFRISINFEGVAGLVLLDQVRAVDKLRLTRRLGTIPEEALLMVLAALQEMFAP